MTELDELAGQNLPAAEEVGKRFEVVPNRNPASEDQWQQALSELKFGTVFGDHMASMSWNPESGWFRRRIEAFAPIELSPAAAVLHYGQEIFEGMKAYRWRDDSIWTFRPGFNAARFNHSARRMAMPEIDLVDFLASLVQAVRIDQRWVPASADASLYLRPFMFASEPFLGVRTAHEFTYMMISTPVGPYFKGGLQPVPIWVTEEFHRAAPGGTGTAKCGGNYAGSLLPQQLAAEKGYQQVCYLDAVTNSSLEELGGMNVFVVRADGTVQTPALSGTILEGGTRAAIITLLRDRDLAVEETRIELEQLITDINAGVVVEMFACGTAAVVTPIGEIAGENFQVNLEGGSLTASIHEELSGIQRGTVADRHGWMYRLV